MPCRRFVEKYKEYKRRGYPHRQAKNMAAVAVYGRRKKRKRHQTYFGLEEGWIFK